MPDQEAVIQDFADALWAASDETALRRVADRTAARLGFKWFAYLERHDQHTAWISTYPGEWIERYFEKNYDRIDPVLSTARQRRRVFTWSGENVERLRSSTLRRFFGEARAFAITSGATVPVRSGFGHLTALTFATDEPGREVEKRVAAAGDVLELIGLYYHARAQISLRGASERAASELSPRESQCLTWAARGKTRRETGAIMGVTVRTVEFHLDNARRKLNACNVTQAVAVALRGRLIP